MGRLTVYGACAASLALGLFFLFVWAPHPWGWEGFDDYHDLGLALARAGRFPTLDRPWGYALYLAPFYALFGDRPWIPLIVQVVINAAMPMLVYRVARGAFDERIAATAAVLTGLCSFNTVYASTQASDALCTVLFMAAVLVFARGSERRDGRLYACAASGALLGLASQFRPNLILVPFVLAGYLLIRERGRALAGAAAVVVAAAVTLLPLVVSNGRLAGEWTPTSTHGGMQLWYGTLQSGPYLKSRAYNPRRVFETGSFPYTSLDAVPLIVTWQRAKCATGSPLPIGITYWTDRDATRRHVNAIDASSEFRAELPPS